LISAAVLERAEGPIAKAHESERREKDRDVGGFPALEVFLAARRRSQAIKLEVVRPMLRQSVAPEVRVRRRWMVAWLAYMHAVGQNHA
jgi:hypothetical protein